MNTGPDSHRSTKITSKSRVKVCRRQELAWLQNIGKSCIYISANSIYFLSLGLSLLFFVLALAGNLTYALGVS
jgi:hypothetical protein